MKISVIAIFYNSQKWCQKCVDSILSQRNVNIEAILVDDHSSDSTLSILRSYSLHDSRIKVVEHDFNKGISAARNSGMQYANGDFVFFIDGDDWLHDENSLSTLISNYAPGVDCIRGSYEFVYEDGAPSDYRRYPYNDFRDRAEIINKYDEVESCLIHNALFAFDILKKHSTLFREGRTHEDVFFCLDLYPYLNHIIQVPNVTYCYYFRKSSLSHQTFPKKYDDMLELLTDMMREDEIYKRKADDWAYYQFVYPYFYQIPSLANIDLMKLSIIRCRVLGVFATALKQSYRLTGSRRMIYRLIDMHIPLCVIWYIIQIYRILKRLYLKA